MFFVPLAQTVDYKHEVMRQVEAQSHYARGVLLVTGMPAGQMEPLVKRALAEADPNLTVATCGRSDSRSNARSISSARSRAWPGSSGSSR